MTAEPPPSPPRSTVPAGPAPVPGLPLTGERTVPDVADEAYWFHRHVAAYRLAAELADGAGPLHAGPARRIVDAGCGEGYGLALVAGDPAAPDRADVRVVGVELDPSVAEHARRRYATDPRIEVVEADLARLPFADATVDLVVHLQVVEHLPDPVGCLAELGRITRTGGTILVSTPNRRTFSPGDAAPVNPFHVREFAADELVDVLAAAGLPRPRLFGLHHGPRLTAVEHARATTLHAALTAGAPTDWPDWLAALVATVTPDDFVLLAGEPGEAALEDALDLVAVVTVPGRSAA
jgi:SAM-dependent methyltransferase